jgi:hydrogenase maturation protease
MNARHIVCFGNEWHGDDGFGIRVYEQLCRLAWPRDVRVFNAGIAGLDALRFLEDCRQAVLVDALIHSGRSGEIRVFRPEDLADCGQPPIGHGAGLAYLLQALRVVREPLPDILIVGAGIEAVKPFAPGLSENMERAVPETVRLIRSLVPA